MKEKLILEKKERMKVDNWTNKRLKNNRMEL